jgi:hypothetical protein
MVLAGRATVATAGLPNVGLACVEPRWGFGMQMRDEHLHAAEGAIPLWIALMLYLQRDTNRFP